eukprot:1366789-Amorphochlora_amoeboformis.AAC.2
MESRGEGAQVIVKGNLPQLGTWEGAGVPMSRDAANPTHWSAEIELPFALGELSPTGIFEWKYV